MAAAAKAARRCLPTPGRFRGDRDLRKESAARQGTPAVHALGSYQRTYGLKETGFRNAWIAENSTLALLLNPQMAEAEQDLVCESIREALDG